jgi:hypothetical protein
LLLNELAAAAAAAHSSGFVLAVTNPADADVNVTAAAVVVEERKFARFIMTSLLLTTIVMPLLFLFLFLFLLLPLRRTTNPFKTGVYAVTPPLPDNNDEDEEENRRIQLVKIIIKTVKQCVSTVVIGQRRCRLLLKALRMSLSLTSTTKKDITL